MYIKFDLYPGGKKKALTMSYDDGRDSDRKLVGIFNKYGIRGTFHLNSGLMTDEKHIRLDEIKELYRGHEISSHGRYHHTQTIIPKQDIIAEMVYDRAALEERAGYPVRGMSYPNCAYSAETISVLRGLGIEYSRTVNSTNSFGIPDDFMIWNPTCHHNGKLLELLEQFKTLPEYVLMPLFYVWGHSYEFPACNNWELMEQFCEKAGGDGDVWYATNIEIVDYVAALKALRFSVDCKYVYNPSAISVFFSADGKPFEAKPGATTIIQ